MSAGGGGNPLMVTVRLPGGVQQVLGNYKAALKEIRKEIKEAERDAKALKKADELLGINTGMAAQRRGDVTALEHRRSQVEDAEKGSHLATRIIGQDIKDKYEAAAGLASRVASAARGNIGVGDIRDAGKFLERKGVDLLAYGVGKGGRMGAIAARVGATVGSNAGAIATMATRMAIIGGVAGFGAQAIANEAQTAVSGRQAGAEARGGTEGAMLAKFTADRYGSEFTAEFMAQNAKAISQAREDSLKIATDASITEKARHLLGYTSGESYKRAEQTAELAMKLNEFERKTGVTIKESDALRTLTPAQIKQEMIKRGYWSPSFLLQDLITGGGKTDQTFQDIIEERQQQLLDRKKEEIATAEREYNMNPKRRAQGMEFQLRMHAIEQDRIGRFLNWSRV